VVGSDPAGDQVDGILKSDWMVAANNQCGIPQTISYLEVKMKPVKYPIAFLLILVLLVPTACGSFQPDIEKTTRPEATDQPAVPTQAEEIPAGVLVARDLALAYVANIYGGDSPPFSLDWAMAIVSEEGLVGAVHYRFAAEDWTIIIVVPVIPLDLVVYQVTISNPTTSFEWQGTVDTDGQVTEEVSTDVTQIQAIGWMGAVYALSPEGQFDDYVLFQSGGAFGITGANANLEAEIIGLRDKSEPGKYAHFWGTLTCKVPAFNGCELMVTRLRVGATATDPEPIEGLEGRAVSGFFNSGLTESFVLTGPIPTRYGLTALDGIDSEIAAQLRSLRDTNSIIRVSGQLVTGVPDVNGSQLQVTEFEVVQEASSPAEMEVFAWYGYVHTNVDPRAGFDSILVLPYGGVVGMVGANANLEAEIVGLRDKSEPGKYAHFWGTLTCNLPSDGVCLLTVSRLREDGPGEFFDPDPVEGWDGILVSSTFNMGLTTVLVNTEVPFPVYFGLDSTDPEISAQFEALRDSGAVVRVWGELYAGVMNTNATSIMVAGIEVLGSP